jgi:site-specific recombinase XerD
VKLSTLADDYLKFFQARGASPKTIECYDLTYRQFVAYLLGRGVENDLHQFTAENVEGFTAYLAENGRKASSINVKLAGLHSLGQYGMRTKDARGKYHLAENPLDRVFRPKRQKPAEKYLYLAELKQLMEAPCPAHERLALDLLVDTALRVSELTHAKVEHLSLDGERVLLAVTVKGGRPRTIVLGPAVAERLLESLKFREARPAEPLLVNGRGEPWTRTSLSEAILRLATRAGVTRIPVRPHVLRHSVATLAIARGADIPTVAAMLNHSDIHTVQKYVHRHEAVDAAREAVREVLR